MYCVEETRGHVADYSELLEKKSPKNGSRGKGLLSHSELLSPGGIVLSSLSRSECLLRNMHTEAIL